MSIFISIAAYRDPQLVPTIEDCLAKAAHPDRLRFGICWQHGPEEEPLPWGDDPRFRIIDVDWQASRGACWARAEIMNRYAGEDYFLQLDSHHRFANAWDEVAIDELERAPSTRPILTAYATPFNPDHPEAREHLPMQMNFDRFTEHGIILFRPGELRDWRDLERPARARFLSAHFLFTIGRFVQDVPYDPELYFTGEEITMAVRAYTHGYDIFHPRKMIVWHEYTREYRPHKHWTDHNHDRGIEVAWHERDRSSLDKVQRFLERPEIGPFGLGPVRTFAEYEAFAGVNFARRRAQEFTRNAYEPPNPPMDAGWADRIRSYALELVIDKARLPVGVDDYHFWYVGVHDASGLEICRRDADRAQVQALMADPAPHALLNCAFETDRTPASWTVWPVSDARGWLDRIDGPVIPDHPPVTLVTALLDINRDQLGPAFARSFGGHYVPQFERLLATDLPMVVYAEPDLEPIVWRHRDPFNTKLVLVNKGDLERLPCFGRVQQLRANVLWQGQAGWIAESPQAALAHYNPLVFSKMRWLAEAAHDNPFRASHLYWIDAGLPATVPEGLLASPSFVPRLVDATADFLWIGFPHRGGREIHGFPRAELSALAGVAGVDRVVRGGFFGGRVERIRHVAHQYDELLTTTLERGLMGTEESLFTILAYRNPDQYTHYVVEPDGLLTPFFESLVRGEVHARKKAPAILPVLLPPVAPSRSPAHVPEIPEDIERGATTFMGQPMMQNGHAVPALNALVRDLDRRGQRVARIIEIGTGPGGLSVFFQLYCLAHGAAFTTYDKHDSSGREPMFSRLGIDSRRKDVSHEFVANEIARDIQLPGVTLVVCDGADKVGEVSRLTPFLKPGDLIMAHDYAVSTEVFEREMRGQVWNWCEITDADIAETIAKYVLEPVLPELLGPAAWMCKVKRGAHVTLAARVQGQSGTLAVYVLTFNAPEQLAMWMESASQVESALLDGGGRKVLLDNSTDDALAAVNGELATRFGFEHVRQGNLGIVGGRLWCARHFAEQTDADFMTFFEDDMLWHDTPGLCRNGLPTQVPGVIAKAIEILQNEPELGFLKLSYTEFYGDHRENWAYYNLDTTRRAELFPEGHRTRIDLIKSHGGVSYAIGEVHYSNWPMLVTRRANDLLFLQAGDAARLEQTLMVHALELARAGALKGAVLLASPINHHRQIHYPGQRKES